MPNSNLLTRTTLLILSFRGREQVGLRKLVLTSISLNFGSTVQNTANHVSQFSHPSPPPSAQSPERPDLRLSRATRDENPIGLVYSNKRKFKCSKSTCSDLTFGRMADLRRHYDQTHARHRVQYYCGFDGCSRSHAQTGGRGRSFGTRKDKRDEHERNVHKMQRANSQSSHDES